MSYCQSRETHGACKFSTKANFSVFMGHFVEVHVCGQSLQLFPTLCNTMDCRLLCPWDSPGKNTGVGCHAVLQGDLPNPGIEPSAPALQADSLPTELPGKPGSSLTVFTIVKM